MAKNFEKIGKGLYRHLGSGAIYERVQRDGKDTMFKLPVDSTRAAEALRGARILQHEQAKHGLFGSQSPYEKHAAPVREADMEEVLRIYAEAGYPDKKRRARSGKGLHEEKRRVEILKGWPGWKEQAVSAIRPAVLDRYEAWRRKTAKGIRNGRTIDMELATLKSALRWAVRQERLQVNPLANMERTLYQDADSTQHCRESRPTDATELHRIARHLFADVRSQASGFQLLFEAFTGLRTSEALACRWDAKPGESGYLDGDVLHIKRAKRGVNPWVKVHPALADLLKAMRAWHLAKYESADWLKEHGKCPWFFPSYRCPGTALDVRTLAHNLRDYCRETGTARRTSHGLRAYYVTVRRSEGASDAIVAAEIGDKTGPAIIASTYGDLPPNWQSTTLGKLTWLPAEGEPAWSMLKAKGAEVLQLPKAA